MIEALRTWCRRRGLLREAAFKVTLADLQARRRLAPYRAKSEIEWDLKWASPLRHSWKDEAIIMVLSLPVVCWFLPPTHEYAVSAADWLRSVDPHAPLYFLLGWGSIITATFGIRQAGSLMMPGRIGTLVDAMSKAPDEVPDGAVKE